jgi:hypothetical protein
VDPAPPIEIPAEIRPAPANGVREIPPVVCWQDDFLQPDGTWKAVLFLRPQAGGECARAVDRIRDDVRDDAGAVLLKSRVTPSFPDFPEAARRIAKHDGCCVMRLFVDVTGRPYAVEPRSCPEVFVPSAVEGLKLWRFYPFKVDGTAVRVSVEVALHYKVE